MKHFKSHSLAILPLLSILALSPMHLESKYSSNIMRGIASSEQEAEIKPETVKEELIIEGPAIEKPDLQQKITDKHPKLSELTAKIKQESQIKDSNLDVEKLNIERNQLKVSLVKARQDFIKDSSDEKLVKEQREQVEQLVIKLLLVDGGLKELQEGKKIDQAEDDKTKQIIAESEDILEGLLSDLDINEGLVASTKKSEEPKAEEKPVVVAEIKKEEDKKEEDKKEVAQEQTEEKAEVACEHENKVASPGLEQLISQQNLIMQNMMNMMMMQTMMQNQMMMQMTLMNNLNSLGMKTPYEYADSTNAGNWVYMPRGNQQGGTNIFLGDQSKGIYPDSNYQSNWQLAPQMNFGMPQNGTFGGNPVTSFNLENPMQVPAVQTLPVLPQQPVVQQPAPTAQNMAPLAG